MTKRTCWTAVLCLGLMLAGGSRLRAADLRSEAADLKTKMAAEGWKQVAEGVFERERGEGKVEHLGYGREGLAWTVGKLTRQLEGLMREYESYPSEDLARIIDDLSVDIANARRELRSMPDGLSVMAEAVTGPSCSNICYGASADAFHLTTVQGVKAVADAKFNSSCGYSGTTSAYAYARATLNGTTNTVSQSDPDSGTNITSTATATANGGSVSGIPCYSEASASAASSALGISYSTSDTNSLCPVPATPPSVTINGSSWEYFYALGCRNVTWTSTVSNLTGPYTYQWTYNGTAVGTGSSYTRSVCPAHSSFTLGLTVTGSNGSASDTHYVDVYFEYNNNNCGGPGQPICP